MSLALYRKYRSRTLDDIVGQEHVTGLLKNAIKHDKIAHAYLFTGPRGVGKTSIARIIAHAINELPYESDVNHLDIIEIDAASNNGVDDIRDLRERVQTAPSTAKKKVYIIDEVHMLSKAAFNALLKTLEEPPSHVVFILATTDIDKVPDTILSRTQRHTFRKASHEGIVQNLKRIADAESITYDEDALSIIAAHSHGSFRDSVSLFDQLISGISNGEKLNSGHVTSSLGLADEEDTKRLVEAVVAGDIARIRELLDTLDHSGVPARTTAEQVMTYIAVHHPDSSALLGLTDTLMDVARSSYPELKLLTSLGLFAAPAQPVPTSATPQIRESAPPTRARQAPTPPKGLAKSAAAPTPKVEPVEIPLDEETPPKKVMKSTRSNNASTQFDWNALLKHVRAHHVAFYSVLSKAEPVVEGSTLTLYTRTLFYKKKLDDLKYRTLLNESLVELGMGEFDIETVPTTLPLKDTDAAKVAAIMGGGEAVDFDDE